MFLRNWGNPTRSNAECGPKRTSIEICQHSKAPRFGILSAASHSLSPDSSPRVPSPRPFILAAAGIAALCALDAAVKELTRSYSVGYAVLGRYVFGTVFALVVWRWQGRPRLTREMLPAHILRGALITITAFLFFYSLTRLGMAEAITLSFVAPLLIPPLAHLFLGEKMRGPVNSDIKLTVRRGTAEPFELTLTRAVIKVQSVRSRVLWSVSDSQKIKRSATNRRSRPETNEFWLHKGFSTFCIDIICFLPF